jgi:hypothetical protein
MSTDDDTLEDRTMQERMKNPAMIIPEAMQPIQALAASSHNKGVPEEALALVHLRASQIRGRTPALLLSIATTNVFNRLNIPTRQVAGAWGGVRAPPPRRLRLRGRPASRHHQLPQNMPAASGHVCRTLPVKGARTR